MLLLPLVSRQQLLLLLLLLLRLLRLKRQPPHFGRSVGELLLVLARRRVGHLCLCCLLCTPRLRLAHAGNPLRNGDRIPVPLQLVGLLLLLLLLLRRSLLLLVLLASPGPPPLPLLHPCSG